MTRRSYEGVLLPVALYAASFALLVAAARTLGIATGEPPRLAAAIDAAQLFSPAGKLVATWAERLDLALATGKPSPLAPTILGGYLWAILARPPHATLDGLTALRLGSVAVAAAIAPLVNAVARPALGRPLAILAAALTLFAPRALVDGATLSGDGVAVALALGAVWMHLEGVERRSAGRGVASAALLGLAVAVAPSTLVLVPVIVIHFAMERPRSVERLASRGLFPLPIAVAALPVAGAVAFMLAQPHLAHHTGDRLRDLALAAASPSVGAGTWHGVSPTTDTIPRTHAAASLLVALPSTTAVLACVGVIAVLRVPHEKFRDGGSRARLAALALAGVVLWPLFAPRSLIAFPSHWALGVPFAAVLAALGAGVLCRAIAGVAPRALLLAAAAGLPLGACLPTRSLGAHFPSLTGTTARGGTSGLAMHDGTPVGALAATIDDLGLAAPKIYAPEVSDEAWSWMNRLGRMRTVVIPTGRDGGATLVLVSGDGRGRGGTVVGEVRREGRAVVTLLRRLRALSDRCGGSSMRRAPWHDRREPWRSADRCGR